MSLLSHIESLRAKPEHVRRSVAFWYSFGITAIIFSFWLASFSPIGYATKGVVAQAVSNAGTPAQSLIAGVGSFAGDIRDIIFGPKKITYSSVQVTPGNR